MLDKDEADASCFLYMSDLSCSWKAETISLLVNKRLVGGDKTEPRAAESGLPSGHIRVDFLDTGNSNGDKKKKKQKTMAVARLEFSSSKEKQQVQDTYQGLAVPHTHNYHHFRFHNSWHPKNESSDEVDPIPASTSIVSVPSPPLHLQIMAVPTKELKRRVLQGERELAGHGDSDACDNLHRTLRKHHQKCKVWLHCYLVNRFLTNHNWDNDGRPCQKHRGVPTPTRWTDRLWIFLRQVPSAYDDENATSTKSILAWPPTTKQRKGVQSSHYLTVRRQHPPYQEELWQLCRDVLAATLKTDRENDNYSLPAYNALAITKNFRGSPHIDAHDQTVQHVIAVGDFQGGHLCCELNDNGTEEVQIDIHNRIGRMDGRKVHWVSAWEGTERYSVVYYSTRKEDWTDPGATQEAHLKWMQEKNREASLCLNSTSDKY